MTKSNTTTKTVPVTKIVLGSAKQHGIHVHKPNKFEGGSIQPHNLAKPAVFANTRSLVKQLRNGTLTDKVKTYYDGLDINDKPQDFTMMTRIQRLELEKKMRQNKEKLKAELAAKQIKTKEV